MKQSFLIALLLLVACDSITESEAVEEIPGHPCFPALDTLADFLPIAEGHTWQYRYSMASQSAMPSQYEEEGTLVWTVLSVECTEAQGRYTIEESRTGDGRWWISLLNRWDSLEVQESRTLTLEEDSSGMVLLPYGNQAFNRYYASAEDTVSTTAGQLSNLFAGGVRGCATRFSTVRLKKCEGMVYYQGGCGHASHSLYLILELESFTKGNRT